MVFIPPGGFSGFAQMTPASRIALTQGVRNGNGNGTRRRRRKAKAAAAPRRARKAKGSRKMKFGSPAWQKKYRVGKFAKK